ncbi:hypothetical protein [Streptomyces avermitilis]|uniref:hypothetical protein n=1 Tax=Streptomyces avermitilis TaxID=33903 RepID=UPI003F4CA450
MAEVFRAGQGPHATGDLLPEFNHADFPFGGVVVERETATERTGTHPTIARFTAPSQTQGKPQLAAAHSALLELGQVVGDRVTVAGQDVDALGQTVTLSFESRHRLGCDAL